MRTEGFCQRLCFGCLGDHCVAGMVVDGREKCWVCCHTVGKNDNCGGRPDLQGLCRGAEIEVESRSRIANGDDDGDEDDTPDSRKDDDVGDSDLSKLDNFQNLCSKQA